MTSYQRILTPRTAGVEKAYKSWPALVQRSANTMSCQVFSGLARLLLNDQNLSHPVQDNEMIKMLRTAAAAGLMAVAVSSQAAVVFSDTFTAPGAGGNPAGYYYFAGHTAEQTFAGTGLTEVDRMTLTLRLVGDQNYATENLGLTFSLNGTDIGSTLYAAGVDDDKNLDFSFTALDSASGDWTVKMRVTTPVCAGCGAVQMGRENPMSLFGSTAVPEPATLAMVGIALLGMGVSRRRSA